MAMESTSTKTGTIIDCYYYEGLWWYKTEKGDMCCPPFVREWQEVIDFLPGRELRMVDYRRDENVKVPRRLRDNRRQRCIAYDKEMREIGRFPSVLAAARGCGLSTTSVRACIKGKTDFVKGYTFRKP